MPSGEIIILAIILLADTILCLAVISRSKSTKNIAFCTLIIFSAAWSACNFLADHVNNLDTALLFTKLTFFSASLMAWLILYFAVIFPEVGNKFTRSWKIIVSILPFLVGLLSFSNLIIKGVEKYDWGVNVVLGRGYPVFMIFFLGYLVVAFGILIKKFLNSTGISRAQIQYLFFGLLITAVFASLTNLILPYVTGVSNLSKYGPYFTIIFIAFTTYAITRYRLMDIRLVIKRSITYLFVIIAVAVIYLAMAYLVLEPLTEYLNISRKIFFASWGLVIVFAFQPIKRYVDKITDRFFFKGIVDHGSILSELSQKMSSVVDMGRIVEIACKAIEERLHVKEAFFLIHVANHVDYYVVARLAQDLKKKRLSSDKGTGEVLEADSPLPGFFSKSSEIVVRDELKQKIINQELPKNARQYEGILSVLNKLGAQVAIPLKAKGGLVGIFMLSEKKSGEIYTKGNIEFFQILSSQLATAIERSRLYDRLQIKINELISLQELSKIVNSSLDINKTLNAVMDAVIKVAGVDRALLYLLDRTGRELVATVGRGDKEEIYRGVVVDLSKSSLGYVVQNKKPLIVEDIDQDKRVNKEYARAVKTKGFIAVPLMTKEKVLGVIGVDNRHSGRPLSSVNIELLMTFASQAAIAIDNTRLYQEVKDFNISLKGKVDEATKRLKELLKIKSDFLTVASHQLRTPTSIVRGMLSLVNEEEGLTREEKDRFISQAYEGINRLERIIHDLLNATELEGKKMKLDLKPVQLENTIKEIIVELTPLAKDKGISLRHKKPARPLPKVKADPIKIREVIQNLVDNAIHYTPEGEVIIETEHDSKDVKIIVQDTGIGMTKKDKQRLYKKFSRGEGVLQIYPNGSGLGLFIAKKILEGMNGTISAKSEGRGKGSTFTITIPR